MGVPIPGKAGFRLSGIPAAPVLRISMKIERRIKLMIAVAILVMAATAIVPFKTAEKAGQLHAALLESETRIAVIAEAFSLMKDAESGQRGFIITGQESFLEPYYKAVARLEDQEALRRASLPGHAAVDVDRFEGAIQRKLDDLARSIELRRSQGNEAARASVSTGRGKQYMDDIRVEVAAVTAVEQSLRDKLRQESAHYAELAAVTTLAATVIDLFLVAVALHFLFRLLKRHRSTAIELQSLSNELRGGMAELGRRNVELSLLAQMVRTLDSSMSLAETLQSVSVFTARILPGTSGELFLYRNSRNLLEKASQWGEPSDPKDAIEPHECWGLRLGRVHQVQGRDALYCPHHDRRASQDKFLLCLPLSAQGEIIGLITVEAPALQDADAPLAPGRTELATALAEQLALVLSNAKLKEVLKQQSIVDPLTNLFNRRYMDETLSREMSRARRKSCPLSLVMIDIDHFKSVNDRYGHEAGDAVLRAVAGHIKSSVREGDLVCRFGGEEMVILMPECDLQDAGVRAEKLRAGVRALSVDFGGQTIGSVTASFGVACFPFHGTDEASLIAAADKAMYQAKAAGRDRVLLADTPQAAAVA